MPGFKTGKYMFRMHKLLLIAGFAAILAGCDKGIDTTLSTQNEESYRTSLDRAVKDMTPEQITAYDWAVSNLTLAQLNSKYPGKTPKDIITQEADEYVILQTQKGAELAANFAADLKRIEAEETALADVQTELAKITATAVGIKKANFGFGDDFTYQIQNNSRFDISKASWDAWLFVDDEERSDRYCIISGYFASKGGLPSGKSITYTADVGFMDCRSWTHLDVKNAKQTQFRLDLRQDSVANFSEKQVLPKLTQPTRAEYEEAISNAKAQVETALLHKAAVQ